MRSRGPALRAPGQALAVWALFWLSGFAVKTYFQGGVNRQYSAQTDDKGKYQQILTAGRYRITASKEGYQGGFMEQAVNAALIFLRLKSCFW